MVNLSLDYADDGGSLTQKSVRVGFRFQLNADQLGFGLNWGEPNEDTWAPGFSAVTDELWKMGYSNEDLEKIYDRTKLGSTARSGRALLRRMTRSMPTSVMTTSTKCAIDSSHVKR